MPRAPRRGGRVTGSAEASAVPDASSSTRSQVNNDHSDTSSSQPLDASLSGISGTEDIVGKQQSDLAATQNEPSVDDEPPARNLRTRRRNSLQLQPHNEDLPVEKKARHDDAHTTNGSTLPPPSRSRRGLKEESPEAARDPTKNDSEDQEPSSLTAQVASEPLDLPKDSSVDPLDSELEQKKKRLEEEFNTLRNSVLKEELEAIEKDLEAVKNESHPWLSEKFTELDQFRDANEQVNSFRRFVEIEKITRCFNAIEHEIQCFERNSICELEFALENSILKKMRAALNRSSTAHLNTLLSSHGNRQKMAPIQVKFYQSCETDVAVLHGLAPDAVAEDMDSISNPIPRELL